MKYISDANNNFKNIIKSSKCANSTKYLIAQLTKLREAINEARDTGATDSYLFDLENRGLSAITADLLINKQTEFETTKAQLTDLKSRHTKNYEKDFALNDFRIRTLERRLYGKTDEELQKMVQNKDYIFNDPNMSDAFLAVLNDRNLDDLFTTAKVELANSNYDEPHLKTEEGKLLKGKLELINPGSKDLLLRDESGKTFGLSIGELWELTNSDDDDSEGHDE